MIPPQPLRFAVASCWHESYHEGTPTVPLGPFDLEDMHRRAAPADEVVIWPLTDRCESSYLQWAALWVVLELEEGRAVHGEKDAPRVEFARARALHHGRPQEVCAWLLANKLPVPGDDTHDVVLGRNTERVASELGAVIVAGRWGHAEGGFMSIACAFMGDAVAGTLGVAVNTCSGTARAGDKGAAVTTHWSDAIAGRSGVAAALDEFQSATAGQDGTAVAGFGGRASVGASGVAIALSGTVRGGQGAILVIRRSDRLHVARVGEDGIKPDTPYHVRDGRFVEGEWDIEAWGRGELG